MATNPDRGFHPFSTSPGRIFAARSRSAPPAVAAQQSLLDSITQPWPQIRGHTDTHGPVIGSERRQTGIERHHRPEDQVPQSPTVRRDPHSVAIAVEQADTQVLLHGGE